MARGVCGTGGAADLQPGREQDNADHPRNSDSVRTSAPAVSTILLSTLLVANAVAAMMPGVRSASRLGIAGSAIVLGVGDHRRVAPDAYITAAARALAGPGQPRHHGVFHRDAAVDLGDHVLRERAEMQVDRHQGDDLAQRAGVLLADLDEGLPERLARLGQPR